MDEQDKVVVENTDETTPSKKPDKTPAKKGKKSDKPSIWKRMGDFFKSYKGELKKITWPTAKQTMKNTGTVLLTMAIMGVFVCLLDLALGQLVQWLLMIGA